MRRWLSRLVALALAVLWITLPGYGLIDLSETWDPDWPVVLDAGWGLFVTIIIGVPLLVICIAPTRGAPALVQLACAGVALTTAAALSQEAPAAALAAVLIFQMALVAFMVGADVRPRREFTHPGPNVPLLLVAVAAAPAWLIYAWHMASANRQPHPHPEVTVGVDHYAVQTALALSLVFLPVVGSWCSSGRALITTCASSAAFYLGLISYAWPGAEAGFSRPWSLTAMLWAVVLTATTVFSVRPGRATTPPPRPQRPEPRLNR